MLILTRLMYIPMIIKNAIPLIFDDISFKKFYLIAIIIDSIIGASRIYVFNCAHTYNSMVN